MANEIIKTHIVDDLYMYSINYDAGSDCGPAAGKKLTGGSPMIHEGKKYVKFKEKVNGKQIALRVEGRPDLEALVAEYDEIQAKINAERDAKIAAEKAKQEAIDKQCLEEMHAKADELRKQIPADHIEVTVTKTGDSDGWPILEYTVGDTKLNWQDVNTIGAASAIRPGAMGAFEEIWIASISKAKLEEIRKKQQADAEAAQIKKEAREKELTETEIPQAAIDAYNEYHGDANKAWEAEDEAAWALIEKWTPYIEAQLGIDRIKLRKIVNDATREERYGVNDG